MTARRSDIASQIADDLDRSDLTDQIGRAIETTIRNHENDRYTFNQVYSYTTTLSSSAATIPLSRLDYRFLEIDRIRLVRSSTWYEELEKSTYQDVMSEQDVVVYTPPLRYTVYADTIQFDGRADQNYGIIIDGLISLGNNQSNSYSANDTTAWFNDARDMIRAGAKKDLFAHVIKDNDQALAMSVLEDRAHKMLKGKANQKVATGQISPVDW